MPLPVRAPVSGPPSGTEAPRPPPVSPDVPAGPGRTRTCGSPPEGITATSGGGISPGEVVGAGPTSSFNQAWLPALAELGTTQLGSGALPASTLVMAASGTPRTRIRTIGELRRKRRTKPEPAGRTSISSADTGPDPYAARLLKVMTPATPVIDPTSHGHVADAKPSLADVLRHPSDSGSALTGIDGSLEQPRQPAI